ncbi:SurA N-terminal domain-containing protein, partial [Bordetella petrii]|uniref:SurA N-terminal domain-containing protein n=1 Tax=Bordetella petrii TaxID=94624 RepID=UPI001E33B460
MMRSLHILRRLPGNLLVLAACAGVPAVYAQQPARPGAAPAPAAAPQPEQFVDGIAAVVNKDVITLREVDSASVRATQDLKQRGIQVPPPEILRRQVLQSLIMDRLQTQEADRMGIRVNDAQIDQAIQTIAERNRLPVAQMRAEVEKSGVSWTQYRESLSHDIRMNRLRQRAVDANIIITDAEVDAFLKDRERNPAFGAQANAPAPGQQQPPRQPAQPAQSGP